MCIIVFKPKGVKLPSKKTLKKCFDYNNDGAGFMYNSGDHITIKKGYMTFNELYNDLLDIDRQKNIVIHFRIGTQGANTSELTHPFDLFNVYSLDKKIKTKIGVVHNGIINLDSCYSLKHSDTQLYVDLFLKKFYDVDNRFYKKEKWQELIETSTNSKMIIFDKNDAFMIGEFILDDGVYYSNNTYKSDLYPKYLGAPKTPYNYGYNDDTYDDFDGEYADYKKELDRLGLNMKQYTYTDYLADTYESNADDTEHWDDYLEFLKENDLTSYDLSYSDYEKTL